ncbi:MAG: S26 family signal peptidase, partial [Halodesulfurarchaeum sp.]
GVIDSLYAIHHWLPIVAIDVLLGGGLYLIGWLVLGRGRVRPRQRDRSRGLSLFHRAKRFVFGIE